MARSKVKTPVFGNCTGKDTWHRRKAAKIRRVRANQAVRVHQDGDMIPDPKTLRLGCDWVWPRDGRRFRLFKAEDFGDWLAPRWKVFIK